MGPMAMKQIILTPLITVTCSTISVNNLLTWQGFNEVMDDSGGGLRDPQVINGDWRVSLASLAQSDEDSDCLKLLEYFQESKFNNKSSLSELVFERITLSLTCPLLYPL